eukprot:GHVU01009986.1.p2 GENE.GHVU01009986.1~~GHVU01009986.1.p2  ORF type:complete len:153 (+),score=30.11 GHVU01009986.1:215-673(+)
MTKYFVTGSTDGIGKHTAARLLAAAGKENSLIIHGRDEGRVRSTVAELKATTGNGNVWGYVADLAEVSEVRRLAEEVRRDHPTLDVLINNAGVIEMTKRKNSNGIERVCDLLHGEGQHQYDRKGGREDGYQEEQEPNEIPMFTTYVYVRTYS